jgi:hypothetical protein
MEELLLRRIPSNKPRGLDGVRCTKGGTGGCNNGNKLIGASRFEE